MPPLYDLIIDFPDGIKSTLLEADDRHQAFAAGKKLFPGLRLALALREDEGDDDLP